MSIREKKRDIFKSYPWLKIVLAIIAVIIVFLLIILGLSGSNKGVEDDGTGEQEVFNGENRDEAVGEVEGASEVEQIGAGKIIALTFDDGPSEYTGRLLDALKERRVKATFFVLGRNANVYPDLIRREIEDGHEVESHTMNHQNLAKLGESEARAEVIGAEQAICAIEGKANCIKYLRPPYGEVSDTVKNIVGVPMIGWSIDTEDWASNNPQMMQDRTFGVIRGNAVILMHDIYETSIEGAERIIDGLKAAGFTFVTVDELVQARGGGLESGVYYGRFD